MTKLLRRAPLAIAVALMTLALHASGCTSLLGDLPSGESVDGSVSESGGDTSPGEDVAADASTDHAGGSDGPSDSGEAGAPCSSTTCPAGCCNATGQCVPYAMQGPGTCGKGGLACGPCANGNACSNGACTCGGAMCNGCCGTGNMCVSTTSNTQCGANGAMCLPCSSDQTCDSQGQCVCNPATCSGCCDPTSQHCVTTTNTTQCGKGGAMCATCPSGQECVTGACVCDSTSCNMGCCLAVDGGTTGTCEFFSAQSYMSCGKNGATCAGCPTGQTCDGSGNCVCNASSCPKGCCDSTTGLCVDWLSQTPSSCGTMGNACGSCTSGLCDTTNGTCSCDSNTCASGCCVGGSTGTCEAYGSQSLTSCGASGATCTGCSGADSCTSGVCGCAGTPACAAGKTCCASGCTDVTSDANNCGACAHACGPGSSCSNSLCTPITLGQTTYHLANGARGITVGAGGTVFVSEYNSNLNNGYIESCPVTGCPGTPPTATAIFTDAGNAGLGQIIWDPGSTNLYFGDVNQSSSYGITTAGTQLFRLADPASGLATDATYLYLADFQGLGYVNKTTGGTVTRIISTLSYTQGVAVDQNDNIWAAARNNNIVAVCTRAGVCSQWTWTSSSPQAIAIIGGVPYVLAGSGFYKCASISDCTQANATQLTTQGGSTFSYDTTNAYFPFGGIVQVCPLTGCPSPQTLAGANGNVVATAVDPLYVYWVTDSGYIQKVVK